MQSLDGHARKWFKELPVGSVGGIEALDDIFLKHWGERRDHLYYITEFSNLRRENGESVSNFTKYLTKCSAISLLRSSQLTLQPKSLMPMPLILSSVFFSEKEDMLLCHSCKMLLLKLSPISLHLRRLREKWIGRSNPQIL